MSAKKCVLDDRKMCDDCGECDYCDLNPFKICDNCGKCIGEGEEYRELKIDDMIINGKASNKHKTVHSTHSHSHDDDCCCHDEDCDCGEHHD